MNWYYKVCGGEVHVRVFFNGAKCGNLVFRYDEFETLLRTTPDKFIAYFKDQ